MNKKLRKDWKWVKLGEVCDKISLNKIKIKQKEYLQEGLFPVIDQGQNLIGGYYNDINLVIPDNPPFIVFGDHTKIKKYINFKFIPGADGVKVLKAKSNIDSKFLYYSLFTIKIKDKGYARHFQLLEKEFFPLPPLPTQNLIVAKIEELFSELDKGIENLRTAQQQIKTYRQSVLKWAFEGKLTSNDELKITNDEKDGKQLPDGWKWVEIGSVIKKLDQGWSPKCENESSKNDNEWAVIKTSAIQHGYFLEKENKKLPINLKVREQHELKKGDLLITRAGPRIRVGVCCLIKSVRKKLLNCDKVYRINVDEKLINAEYLESLLNSPTYQEEIEKTKSGISDSGLNLTQRIFLLMNIPLPPLPTQHLIVQEIESRLSVADKLEEDIKQSLQQAEALRQSILKKAFEGELV